MIPRIRQFITSPFARSAVTLQVGSMGAMVVQAVAGILLARWLGPEQFGAYALAFSLAMVASVLLGTGAYEAMIPHISRAWHERDEGGGARGEYHARIRPMLAYLAKFVVIAGGVAIVVGFLLPTIASKAYGDERIGWYALAILAAAAVSTTFFEFSKLSSQVTGRIRTLSLLTFGDHASRFSWALGFVLAGFGVVGATTGHLVGALMLGVIAATVLKVIVRHESDWPSAREVISLSRTSPLKPYLSDTLWVLGDRNLAMLFSALPVALAGLFIPAEQVAYFKVAFGYITLALAVLGPISILLNVQFPRIQVTDFGQLRSQFIRVSLVSLGLTLGLTLGIVILAPWFFRILYGPQYDAAIPIVRALAVHGALFGIGVGLGPMWRALSKVRVSIVINLITLGLGIPLGLSLMSVWGVWGAVAMVTLWYVFSHFFSFFYLVRQLSKK